MTALTFTLLGCGSSGGVPRIGGPNGAGNWGVCDPNNPKNNRTRCSALITRTAPDGAVTRVLIDSSPDMRQQLLREKIPSLDAVLYTHGHADHMNGIDDLRMIVLNAKARLAVWADQPTQDVLLTNFNYAFVQPEGSSYPPILDLHLIEDKVTINGAGGDITFHPFQVRHGGIDALGFKIGRLAYLPDVSDISEPVLKRLEGLDIFVLDALRYAPHSSHFSLDESLSCLKQVGAKQGILTNMHIDLDYETVARVTPDNISPGFDGMKIAIPE